MRRLRRGTVSSNSPALESVVMHETEKIWMNGELVAWQDAKVHVLSHALHYGSGVFEGIRAYATDRGPAVFRLMDHLRRLERSAEVYFMQMPVQRRGAAPGDARRDRVQQPRRLLRAAAGLPRLRRAGHQPADLPGRRDHRRLAVGRVPGRGGARARRARDDVLAGAASARTRCRRPPSRAASTSTRSSPRWRR